MQSSKLTAHRGRIVFPNACASFGGAKMVSFNECTASIVLPGEVEPVRVSRSLLPEQSKWTSFNLADAAHAARKGRGEAA